jgi:hypothetical protein
MSMFVVVTSMTIVDDSGPGSPQQLPKYLPDELTGGDLETVHGEWAQQNVNEKHRDALYARVCSSEYLIFDLDKAMSVRTRDRCISCM